MIPVVEEEMLMWIFISLLFICPFFVDMFFRWNSILDIRLDLFLLFFLQCLIKLALLGTIVHRCFIYWIACILDHMFSETLSFVCCCWLFLLLNQVGTKLILNQSASAQFSQAIILFYSILSAKILPIELADIWMRHFFFQTKTKMSWFCYQHAINIQNIEFNTSDNLKYSRSVHLSHLCQCTAAKVPSGWPHSISYWSLSGFFIPTLSYRPLLHLSNYQDIMVTSPLGL